jgi:hypothetical protein
MSFPRGIVTGNFLIVGFISKVLKGLLFLKLNENFNTSFFIDNISLTSLKEIKNNTIGSVRLFCFLYQIAENAYIEIALQGKLETGENKYSLFTVYKFLIIKCFLTSNSFPGMGFAYESC